MRLEALGLVGLGGGGIDEEARWALFAAGNIGVTGSAGDSGTSSAVPSLKVNVGTASSFRVGSAFGVESPSASSPDVEVLPWSEASDPCDRRLSSLESKSFRSAALNHAGKRPFNMTGYRIVRKDIDTMRMRMLSAPIILSDWISARDQHSRSVVAAEAMGGMLYARDGHQIGRAHV